MLFELTVVAFSVLVTRVVSDDNPEAFAVTPVEALLTVDCRAVVALLRLVIELPWAIVNVSSAVIAVELAATFVFVVAAPEVRFVIAAEFA